MPTRTRALPLAAEDRRLSILEAVIPILMQSGSKVTTAEMAEAAGVAEGTIFRVFPDKETLLHEALRSCIDPLPILGLISGIDGSLPFEEKLRQAAEIVVARAERVHAVASVLRSMPTGGEHHVDTHKKVVEANSMVYACLTRLFSEHAEGLAVDPARAAAAFRGLLFAASFPLTDPDELLSAEDVVKILLEGVARRAD